MSVGVAAFEYHQPIEEALDRVLALGTDHCEIATPTNVTPFNAEAVAAAARERGVTITSVASLSKPNAVDDEADVAKMIGLLDDSIRSAAVVGASFAVAYFGGHPTRPLGEGLERYVRLTRDSVALAESLGVTILIENHFSHAPGELTNTAAGCVELVNAVGSDNFAVNFDLCNFAIGGQPFEESYDVLMPHVRNVHIKDARPYDPVADAQYDGRIVTDLVNGDFVFVAVGQGITPNGRILERMRADGLDVPITIEGHVPDDRIDDVFRTGLEFVRGEGFR